MDRPGVPAMIDLSANENPFGPSEHAIRAIAAGASRVHRYPDGDGARLKAVLGKALAVEAGQIVLGNGSCEVIELTARALLGAGDEAVLGWPSFPAYRSIIARTGASAVLVPLAQWAYDLDAMAERITERTRLVILANPNNPTGLALGGAALAGFLDRLPEGVVVIVDEAYGEYVWQPDFADALGQVRQGRPLMVTRSLSKAYGLAGLRLGFGVAPAPLARRVDGLRQHFNTGCLAQDAAIAAFGDRDHLARCVALTAANRHWLAERLAGLGLTVPPSQANFLVVRVGNGREVFERLRSMGVLVKALDAVGLNDCIRVSVGRHEENERFVRALEAVLGTTEMKEAICCRPI